MSFKVVIPARFDSSRLPGKPLADIAGKPMIVHVVEKAKRSHASEVIVATDHEEVRAAVEQHGHVALMTRRDHASGTDRIGEVVRLRGWTDSELVVNVQGDEPGMDPDLIDQVAASLAGHHESAVATACYPIQSADEFFNPNIVKVVCDADGHALYFSRAPIPWARDAFARDRTQFPQGMTAQRHLGIYAYRCGFLRRYGELPVSPLETIEALEQLRMLWHGYRIHVAEAARMPEAGVDTVEDLERVRQTFRRA